VFAHTPHDPIAQIVLSSTYADDTTGFVLTNGRLLRSEDAMTTFVDVVDGINSGVPTWLAITPVDANVVYVASSSGEIFRSDDAGRSFPIRRTVDELGVPLVRIAVASDDADVVIATDDNGTAFRSEDAGINWSEVDELDSVTDVTADSGGAGRFYAGTTTGTALVSADNGRTWDESTGGSSASITSIADSVERPSIAVIGDASGGVFASLNGGASFDPLPAFGLPATPVLDVTIAASDGASLPIVWVTSNDGPYRSTDLGATFDPVHDDLTVDAEAGEQALPGFATLAAGPTDGTDTSPLFLAGFDGVFALESATNRWVRVETLADAITGLAVSPTFGVDRTVAVATYVKGAYLSTDGGSTFEQANAGLDQDVGRSNTVLPVNRLQNIVFSPDFADDHTIYSSTATHFVFSEDAGASWQSVTVAAAGTEGPTAQHFVIGVGRTIIGTAVMAGSRQGLVYRSDRRGTENSWTALADLGGPVRSIVLSPDFATAPVAFVSTNAGVFRTINGASFEPVNAPVRDAILSISPDFAQDGTIFAGSSEGLAVSRDGGDTWEPVSVVFAPTTVEAIGLSSTFAADGIMLVSVRGEGLFRSANSGLTFEPIIDDPIPASLVIADFDRLPTSNPIQFADDGTVFAYADSTVVVSTDGGTSWDRSPLPSFTSFVPSPLAAVQPETTDLGGIGDPAPADAVPGVDDPESPSVATTLDAADTKRDRKIWLIAAVAAGVSLAGLVVTTRVRR
jgi:photosystem II stability/assembly factor-like uncharacterized protein